MSPTALGRRAATRAVVATGAVVALATGGLALANSVGIPLLPDAASDRATESVAKTPKPSETGSSSETAGSSSHTPSGSTESAESSESAEAAEGETSTASPTPTPNFKGLCNAFQATDHAAHGKSLDSAAFTALATEAGGVEQIATYCVALIGEPKETGRPTDKPTPGKPTDKPTPGRPTDKPTPGKPTDKPTPGKPTPSTATTTPGNSGGGNGNSGGNGNGKGGG